MIASGQRAPPRACRRETSPRDKKQLCETDELDFRFCPPRIDRAEPPPAKRRRVAPCCITKVPTASIAHRTFSDLPSLLRAGDLLVFKPTTRRHFRRGLDVAEKHWRKSRGFVSGSDGVWRVARDAQELWRPKTCFSGEANAEPAFRPTPKKSPPPSSPKRADGQRTSFRVNSNIPALELLNRGGAAMPLPPYIKAR